MRAAWRLATNSLSGRPSRSALLVGAVALSAALIAVVSCAMASANRAVEAQMNQTVGRADLRLKATGSGGTLDAALLDRVRRWPEVEAAVGRLQASLPLTVGAEVWAKDPSGMLAKVTRVLASTAMASGVMAPDEYDLRPVEIIEGRLPGADGEVVLDESLVERLTWSSAAKGSLIPSKPFVTEGTQGARDQGAGGNPSEESDDVSEREAEAWNRQQRVEIGDEVLVRRLLRGSVPLRVVGIAARPPLGGRPQCWVTLETLARIQGDEGQLTDIDLVLKEGVDAEGVVRARGAAGGTEGALPRGVLLQTTERITSGLDKNMRSSQLGFVLATVLAFLSASFIIMTGLTTSVGERQRELAVLRCIGATRGQLAGSQLLVGAIVGGAGAAVGVPLGVGFSAIMAAVFEKQLPTGLSVSAWGLILAGAGAVAAGVLGAAWPAYRVASVTPLEGLASRGTAARARGMWITLGAGIAGVLIQLAAVGIPDDGQVVFWGYATVGLPAMFVGYFLLGVPATLLMVRLTAGALTTLLRLPRHLLARSIRATPYRHGFTAGALMGGLALMISIWVNGGAILRDWLDTLKFPDAFVTGINLTEASRAKLEEMPFVEETCAITLQPVETDAFGVRALQTYKTTFIAFEPERFFRMANLQWVQGDALTAERRLIEGGAVIVAREFLVARGLGVGDRFTCAAQGRSHDFEIVGVVTSPGLDIVSKFFNISEDFTEQSLSAVFGSRRDLREKFGSEAIHLIQIALKEGTDDEAATETIRRELFEAGILDAGSGRRIKEQIREFIGGTLLVFSGVAVVAMVVACFGVANVIVAGIQARRFEFGVLRAVGAPRGVLARLVLGEATIIALTACVLGVLMGIQGSWAGQRLYEVLIGLLLELRIPVGPVAAACGVVVLLTLGAAGPAAWGLARKGPRELLGAVRG